MRRFAGIAVLLLLLSAAGPVLACMTDGAMSHAESACCHAMRGKCSGMETMGCCQPKILSEQHPQIATNSPSIDLQWSVFDRVGPGSVAIYKFSPRMIAKDEHSPPGPLPVRIAVLRI